MDFQKLLLDIGNALSSEEVKAMAFLCSEPLEGKAGLAWTAVDLFSRLNNQDRLSPENPHLLIELLQVTQRAPLARPLEPLADSKVSTAARSSISPFRKLLYNLYEELTDDDLNKVKFLSSKQLPRRKLEKSVTTLEVFVEMEHIGLISHTKLHTLKEIIQQVCPILIEKITQFEANYIPEIIHGAQEEALARSQDKQLALDPMSGEKTPSNVLKVISVDDCEVLLSGLSTEMSGPHSSEGAVGNSNVNELLSGEQASVTPHSNLILKAYPMARRGFCLIINNEKFSQSQKYLKDRQGTEVDMECLDKVFKWLGFQVEVQNNCEGSRMLSLVRELSLRDHSHTDCLVCCVLSHGKEDGVYGVDGDVVAIKQLTEFFDGTNCRSLAGKPKLFFIQACQGNKEQRAVYIESDGPSQNRSVVQSDAVVIRDSIPADADFLLGMATVNSFTCYRDKVEGTWYIQTLCRNLVRLVPSGVDLMSILTKVNADVGQKTNSTGNKQMPQPAFSLTKRVVFPVPNEPPPEL
ncbi:caspase-8 [Nelusetta ayraudi]|uniref:caspase-8 n=1 Tax=Nelusetta ayraudi TaxID=303726 RepID=UPI003F6EDA3C